MTIPEAGPLPAGQLVSCNSLSEHRRTVGSRMGSMYTVAQGNFIIVDLLEQRVCQLV
jgi:hypothetical protein